MPKAKPKKKHKTKHVVTHWRGAPVKAKRVKRNDPHRTHGPAPADPDLAGLAPRELAQITVRATKGEIALWRLVAAKTGERLGLHKFTIGPWARRALNLATAKRLGEGLAQEVFLATSNDPPPPFTAPDPIEPASACGKCLDTGVISGVEGGIPCRCLEGRRERARANRLPEPRA